MGISRILGLVALLGAAASEPRAGGETPQAPVSSTGARGGDAVAPAPAQLPVGVDVSEPPPSTWDRQQRSGEVVAPPEEGRSIVEQLVRTVLSLLVVVALIYVLGRFAMARLGRMRGPGGAGLRVVERVQLDARHALFVVEVSGKQKFLVGAGGDKGVTLLAELDPVPEQPTSGESFADALRTTGGAASRGGGSEDKS